MKDCLSHIKAAYRKDGKYDVDIEGDGLGTLMLLAAVVHHIAEADGVEDDMVLCSISGLLGCSRLSGMLSGKEK